MRDGDWLVGLGCATTLYPTNMAPATARIRLSPQGGVRVETATHEIGTGVTTALALTAASELGVPLAQVAVALGDSSLPPAPVAGGSNSTASICTVVVKACAEIRDKIARAAVAAADGPFHGADPAALRLEDGALRGPGNASEPLEKAIGRASSGRSKPMPRTFPTASSRKACRRCIRVTPCSRAARP